MNKKLIYKRISLLLFIIIFFIFSKQIISIVSKKSKRKTLNFIMVKDHWPLSFPFLSLMKEVFDCDIFVETGTFFGDTAIRASKYFETVYTIELDEKLFNMSKEKLKNVKNINVFKGDSKLVLKQILPRLKNKKLLIYLDAHWSGGATAKGLENTPIISELRAIKNSGITDSVIIIDDARFFQNKDIVKKQFDINNDSIIDGYPSLNDLKNEILNVNKDYKIIVYGDVIIAYINKQNIKVSDVIEGMTISRFSDLKKINSQDLKKVIAAEDLIAKANGQEREAIHGFMYRTVFNNPILFSWLYKLWYALTLLNSSYINEGCSILIELSKLGIDDE